MRLNAGDAELLLPTGAAMKFSRGDPYPIGASQPGNRPDSGPCSRRSAFPPDLVAGQLFDLQWPADRERVRALVARFEADAARMPEFRPVRT